MQIFRVRPRQGAFGTAVAALCLLTLGACAHVHSGAHELNGSNDLTTTLREANDAYRHGRLDEARRDYRALLKRVPDNALVLLQLANIDYRLGNMDGAREMYQRSLDAKPEQPQVQFNLAMVELGLAQAHLDQYRQMSGDDTPAVDVLLDAIDHFAQQSQALTSQVSAPPDAATISGASP